MDDPVQMIAVVRGASSAYCRSQEPSEPIIPRSLLLGAGPAIPEVGPAGVTHIAHGPEASDGGRRH
jgi:hypothetical protein